MASVGEILAAHLALIGDLPDEDRAALAEVPARVRDIRRGVELIVPGDRPTHSVVVLDGLLCRYTDRTEGARQIHSFYLPGDAPCLESLNIDYMDNTLAAVVDSRVAFIPNEHLYALMDARPQARKLIWRETLVQAAIFREWLMRNSTMPAHAGMAHLFCEIFTRAQAAGLVRGGACDFPISQQTLADAVGITAVHTNRTLMVLRDSGAVEWRGGVLTVSDWDRLAAIAEFDPQYLHLRAAFPARSSLAYVAPLGAGPASR